VNPFHYTRAKSAAAAVVAIGATSGSRFVAGGTNILDLMKIDVESPSVLVDINALPLRAIERRGGGVFIGALARMSDVAADPTVRSAYPAIAIALDESASPQLRNMASIGGNVLQRTRCPYFRDVATPCNKRAPGSGCGALHGVNRQQAVLGTSEHCIATHPSDLAVALVAFDAVLHLTSRTGSREVALRRFYRLPGATPQIENVLEPGELITGVSIPGLPFATNSTYLKVRDRAQYEFALASAAVALDVAAGTIRASRVALGGVGTAPWRSAEAEAVLANAPATRQTYEKAADAALASAEGHGMNDFKIPLAKRTLVRALEVVSAGA
jgi:xanthine dehydrogenase YagS FAD-binding subunit